MYFIDIFVAKTIYMLPPEIQKVLTFYVSDDDVLVREGCQKKEPYFLW